MAGLGCRAFAFCVSAVVLAGCTGGGQGPRRHSVPAGPMIDDSAQYVSVLKLAENGACAQALPKLRCMAARGPGFEGPQYILGFCLMEGAAGAHGDADKKAEGLTWITRAANAGWGAAQVQLIHLYTEGVSVPRDPVEAQKWRLIHDNNPMRISLGLPELDSASQVQLEHLLSDADRIEAQTRADAWQRIPEKAITKPDEKFQAACREIFKGPAQKKQSLQRPGPRPGRRPGPDTDGDSDLRRP